MLLTGSDTVLERPLVEDVGGEGAERRVHAVLHLQADGPDPQHHQPLEERLRQPGLGGFFTHHDGAQLAVVTDKNQLWKTEFGPSWYLLKLAQ